MGTNTAESCARECPDSKYIGLQYYGNRCWCDDSWEDITRYGATECDEFGAGDANYIYKNVRFDVDNMSPWIDPDTIVWPDTQPGCFPTDTGIGSWKDKLFDRAFEKVVRPEIEGGKITLE